MDEVVQTLQKSRHEGDHPNPGWGKGGGTIRRRSAWRCRQGKEPPAGRPTPDTVEDLEGCFESLVGVAVTGKGVLEELVKSNASITITIATLIDTNARLAKKVETLTAALAKKGGVGVEVPGREPGKYFPNAKGKHGTSRTSALS